MAVPESYEYGYDICVGGLLKNVTLVYNVSNPYDDLMPLQIFRGNTT